MKKYLLLILVLCSTWNIQAATITRGYTFTTNEQVTSTKLHTLVDSATITGIGSGDIGAGSINSTHLSVNSVGSSQITDGSILTADVLSRGFAGSVMATNSITEIELNTNITTRAGLWDLTQTRFVANSITNTAILGVTTSAGAADSGKIPKLNSNGKIDISIATLPDILIYEDQKSSGTVGGTASTGTWTTHVLNVEAADTGNNGSVSVNVISLAAGTYRVHAFATFFAVGIGKIRLRNTSDSSTLVVGGSSSANAGGNGGSTAILDGRFTIAATKNVELQYFVSSSAGTSDLGQPITSGEVEIYAHVTLTKE